MLKIAEDTTWCRLTDCIRIHYGGNRFVRWIVFDNDILIFGVSDQKKATVVHGVWYKRANATRYKTRQGPSLVFTLKLEQKLSHTCDDVRKREDGKKNCSFQSTPRPMVAAE